jgi:hypothetical protein
MVSVLHAESSEISDDIGFQSNTNPGNIAVDFAAEELPCWAEVRYHIFLFEFHFDFNRSLESGLRI